MKKFLSVILCLIMLFITFTAVSIVNYSKKDFKTHSDVAIVLGAGTYSDEVSPVFRE